MSFVRALLQEVAAHGVVLAFSTWNVGIKMALERCII